ncbi:DUF1800 domain-containing protein [Leadbetterella byssophila]|uniref:DUF1800 domain-containing protein n=1 Tax=Leadbetterella byssophila TaxID=316068 RepID=UPI00399FD5A0
MAVVSRRGFLGLHRAEVKAGLEEHTTPLTRMEVRHLLQRCCFALSPNVIDKYVGKTAREVVDGLFANGNTSPAPPSFVNDQIRDPDKLSGSAKDAEANKLNLHYGDYNWDLGGWWVTQMKNDKESIVEKMTFFWHGHLTTQYANCVNIPVIPMYLQNDLFRKNFAGNFYTLLEKICIDGAMLVYLNGGENVAEAPNENFARELLELYSLGVGNYTEADIKEAAKILTGWKIKYFSDESLTPNRGYFNPNDFDKNTKRFFDETFQVNYEVTQENVFNNSVRRLIQVILNKKGDIAAKFMMSKFYKYFVYANPNAQDEKIINELAAQLRQEKFEFQPVLKTLLRSKHFFAPENIGIQLKSPAETIVNMVAHLKFVDKYARNIMSELGLELFNPPNVSGWKGYRSWVSTKSLPTTIYYIHEIFSYNSANDFANWAETIDNSGDRERLTSRILETFFGRPVTGERFKGFVDILGADWSGINKAEAGNRIKKLLENVIKAPEFYLS